MKENPKIIKMSYWLITLKSGQVLQFNGDITEEQACDLVTQYGYKIHDIIDCTKTTKESIRNKSGVDNYYLNDYIKTNQKNGRF